MSEMFDLMEKLKREAKEGGELNHLPCPLCGKPRSQRSDYIRCTPCGMNWLNGEDLDKSPLLSRAPYIPTKAISGPANGGAQSAASEAA